MGFSLYHQAPKFISVSAYNPLRRFIDTDRRTNSTQVTLYDRDLFSERTSQNGLGREDSEGGISAYNGIYNSNTL